MEYLKFRITEEGKAQIHEHLLANKMDGTIVDWFYNILKTNIQMMQQALLAGQWINPRTGQIIPTKQDVIDALIIRHAEKEVPLPPDLMEIKLPAGPTLLDSIGRYYKFEVFVNTALGIKDAAKATFEDFIQGIADMNLRMVIVSNLGRELDTEFRQSDKQTA